MFRNETRATERRAQKANKKWGPHVRGKSGRDSVSLVEALPAMAKGTTSSLFESAIIPAIQIPADTQASCHFVSNYILLPRQDNARGFMDFLIPLINGEPHAKHLHHAFQACALASLGNRVNANGISFSDKAYGEYAKALRATHAAIKDPKTSTSDAALAAVLLLSMFEVSTRLCLCRRVFPVGSLLADTSCGCPRILPRNKQSALRGVRTLRAPSSSLRPEGENSCRPRSVYSSSLRFGRNSYVYPSP